MVVIWAEKYRLGGNAFVCQVFTLCTAKMLKENDDLFDCLAVDTVDFGTGLRSIKIPGDKVFFSFYMNTVFKVKRLR